MEYIEQYIDLILHHKPVSHDFIIKYYMSSIQLLSEWINDDVINIIQEYTDIINIKCNNEYDMRNHSANIILTFDDMISFRLSIINNLLLFQYVITSYGITNKVIEEDVRLQNVSPIYPDEKQIKKHIQHNNQLNVYCNDYIDFFQYYISRNNDKYQYYSKWNTYDTEFEYSSTYKIIIERKIINESLFENIIIIFNDIMNMINNKY